MSYDLYYIKYRANTKDEACRMLEKGAMSSDPNYIDKTEQDDIIKQIKSIDPGLKHVRKKSISGLDSDVYQIGFYTDQIAISMAKWDVNKYSAAAGKIKLISTFLINRGYTGYDPVANELISRNYDFSTRFTAAKVNTPPLKDEDWGKQPPAMKTIFIMLTLAILIYIIWAWLQ